MKALQIAKRMNRSYQLDNLNPSSTGNYLEDFLRSYEKKEIPWDSWIQFVPGTPHCKGRFVVNPANFVEDELVNAYDLYLAGKVVHHPDKAKLRRRIEDRLRKDEAFLFEVAYKYLALFGSESLFKN